MKTIPYVCAALLIALLSAAEGYSFGYNGAKRDVAEHWWDACRSDWRGMLTDEEAIRACSMAMPHHIGLENKWGFR